MNVISAWDVYWVMQLDSIRGVATFCLVAAGVAAAVGLAFAPLLSDMIDGGWGALGKVAKRLFAFVIAPCALCVALLPSSKTAAAMVVLPAVANSETVQTEAVDLYRLAKKALADAIGEEPEAAQ